MKSTKQFLLWPFAFLMIFIVAMPGTGSAYSVMAIGDSITAGYVSPGVYNGGYIPLLVTRLGTGTGYTFVGTQGVAPSLNEGYPGAAAVDFLGVPGSPPPYPKKIEDLVAAKHPDIMLIHLGTNDLNNYISGGGFSPETLAMKFFDSILPGISSQYSPSSSSKPDVYLAQIIPIGTNAGRAAVLSFNSALAAGLGTYSYWYPNINVHLVDMYKDFPNTYLPDDILHPTAAGYQFMAKQWGDAILGPQASVPIPAPVFLLASGLAGLVAIRRRFQHSSGGPESAD